MSIFSMLQGKTPVGGVIGAAGGAGMMGADTTTNALAAAPNAANASADQIAQSHGFPDAQTMMAWHQNYSPGAAPASAPQGSGVVSRVSSALPTAVTSSVLYPFDQSGHYRGPLGGVFSYVANKLGQATGQ